MKTITDIKCLHSEIKVVQAVWDGYFPLFEEQIPLKDGSIGYLICRRCKKSLNAKRMYEQNSH